MKLNYMESEWREQCRRADRQRWSEFERVSLRMAFIMLVTVAVICWFYPIPS